MVNAPLVVPPAELCTDNGAMIAWAGAERLALGLTDGLDVAPRARWLLSDVVKPAKPSGPTRPAGPARAAKADTPAGPPKPGGAPRTGGAPKTARRASRAPAPKS